MPSSTMLISNRYQVIRPLGEGGFGHAYLAEDTQMPSRRKCVIKQLKPITTSPDVYQVVQDRFQREAAILEQLGENHPQIPRLYAYFTENQNFYLVQEWIEGETLEDVAIPQPESRVVSVMTSLLPVLKFIHQQGIIHRDLKPENIILRSGNQQPVLIDFGAVRETMGTVMNSRNNPTSSIVIGTPGYMAAEQAAGRPIPSSDLYSLGLTAIFLLTGEMPQALASDPATGELIWQQSAGHVSEGLRSVIDRAVRSHPRDRYTSATEMLTALSTLPGVSAAPADAQPTMPTPQPAAPPVSQLKTVAVAPAAQAASIQTQVSQAQASQAQVSQTQSLQTASSQSFASSRSDNFERPWFKNPLAIGLIVAVVGGSAIGGGLLANRANQEATVESVPTSEADETGQGDEQRDDIEVSVKAGDRTLDISAGSSPENEAPSEESGASTLLVPEPIPIDPETGLQVVLAGSQSDRIDVFEQPSFDAAVPHYGFGGDRVFTAGETYQSAVDGTQWTRILFESGAAGWVLQSSVIASDTISPDESAQQPPPADLPPEPDNTDADSANADSTEANADPGYASLIGAPTEQIDVYSAPSANANSPHYGVGGDTVQILSVERGEDGADWYNVAFASGAVGWVRADRVQLP
ncbi:MAG: protein kinase [Phormidesmis sp.]